MSEELQQKSKKLEEVEDELARRKNEISDLESKVAELVSNILMSLVLHDIHFYKNAQSFIIFALQLTPKYNL